jgi:plasmid stabilization system protein ParE
MDRLEAAATSLDSLPERGRPVAEVAALGPWLELVIPPWRLVYRVDGSDVRVLAVLDSRRALRDVLFERLVRAG